MSAHNFKLQQGLGDCIVAGATVQEYAKRQGTKVNYSTNTNLSFLFENHPYINYVSNIENAFEFKWVSQIYPNKNYYSYHTMQRFSRQLDFDIDPTNVLRFYDKSSNVIKNQKNKKSILLNKHSKEHNRRYIKDTLYKKIIDLVKYYNFELLTIGDGTDSKSITNIKDIFDLMTQCHLFIGPVSFCYHLSSTVDIDSILICNYMRKELFEHSHNTVSFNSNLKCIYNCEEFENIERSKMNCWDMCKAHPEEDLVLSYLDNYLQSHA